MEPMLYTVKEVAQILKCNATRVYGLKDAGLLPFLKLGQLKCRREAVEEFLRKYEGYVILQPPWFDSLGGRVFRNTAGAVRLSMGFGEPRQQDDVLSDFRHGDCLYNRKCILRQGIA